MKEYKKEFKINGILATDNIKLTDEEVLDMFEEWADNNGFIFSGGFNKVN